MPVVSEFYGIKVAMFYNEHNPPHLHAYYAEKEGAIDIKTAKLMEGNLPKRVLQLVKEWLTKYSSELLKMWQTKKIEKLPPLE